MPATKQIPREQLESYFDTFSKRFLRDGSPEAIDVEVVSPDLGDQFVAEGARLVGIAYDPKDDSLEFYFWLTTEENAEHRIVAPKEVWVIENDDGFVRTVETLRSDDVREVVNIQKVGIQKVS